MIQSIMYCLVEEPRFLGIGSNLVQKTELEHKFIVEQGPQSAAGFYFAQGYFAHAHIRLYSIPSLHTTPTACSAMHCRWLLRAGALCKVRGDMADMRHAECT